MMFGMIPFSRRDDNMFDLFDNFEKNFFGSSNSSMPAFRTDIRDLGDKFLMEAELPGFDKEDIQLDLKDGFLTIKAQHKEAQDEKDALQQPPTPTRHPLLHQRHPVPDPAQAGSRGARRPPDCHSLKPFPQPGKGPGKVRERTSCTPNFTRYP